MSALTGVSATGSVHSVGVTKLIPLTGVSAAGTVGSVSVQIGGWSGLQLTARFKLQMTGYQVVAGTLQITLPKPKLALVGQAPVFATFATPLPSLRFAAKGVTGASGRLVVQLPTPRVAFNQGPGLFLKLPRPKFSAQAYGGVVGTLAVRVKAPVFSVAGKTPVIGTLAVTTPVPRVQLGAIVGVSGQLKAQLRRLSLAMVGATGTLGTLAIRVPVVRFVGNGFWPATGTLKLVLPHLQLSLNGGAPQTRTGGGAAPVANANTLVMHTERLSLTQYTNYPFNSFAKFAGTYIGISDSGIFALTGATDNGAVIQATARSGISDFGTSHLKRVDRIYVGYRTDGQFILRVITDEGNQRDYLVQAPEADDIEKLHGGRVRLGRGVQSRYWQFEMRNVNGSDFTVDIVELKPTKLRRRFGGRDA